MPTGTSYTNVEALQITTGSGNDTIKLKGRYNDTINTGTGDDTIINAGLGIDTVDADSGTDTLIVDYSSNTYGAISTTISANGTGGFNGSFFAYKDGNNYDQINFSNIEKFRITGTDNNDLITTGSGDDIVNGGAGDDTINVGDGNDTVNAVNSITFGLGEKDILTGGAGRDLFILGNATNVYYDDGNTATNGNTDYATITDFNPLEDKVQLRGTLANYRLEVAGSNTNLYLVKTGAEPDELIAVFQDITGLNLTSTNTEIAIILDNGGPDLIVSKITAPIESLSGRSVDIAWTVKNQGNATAEGTWSDRVYLVDASTGQFVRDLGYYSFTGSLTAGSVIERVQSIDIPLDFIGNYKVSVTTDYYRNVTESTQNELNNTSTSDTNLKIQLSPVPNLKVSSISAPATTFSGQQTVVQWTVTNTGTGATNAPNWYDSVYLSLDQTFDTRDFNNGFFGNNADIYLGQVANPSYLNAGDSYSNNLTVTLPRNIVGDYYILVNTDAQNNVIEVNNESDNLKASDPTKVALTPPPDLQVTLVNAPRNAFSGQPINLSWTVTNKGMGRTQAPLGWKDSIFMSSDETLDANDTFVGEFRHFGELVTDQSYIGSATVNLPVGIAGNYFFFVQTDSYNDVYENIFGPNSNGNETYENNNSNRDSNVTNIALTPPPDLEFESLFIPTNARSGRNLSINYKVTNFGATQTPNGDWTDTFYLSTDNQLDIATDIRLGNWSYNGGLNADASYDRTVDFTLSNTLTGTYYVFGVTDSANVVFELNNDNNLFKSTNQVTIVSQPADLLVTSTVIPTIGKAGKTIQAQWTVKNQGIGDTIATNWRDLIFASVNNVLGDADDVVLATFNHDGLLNVNDSYSRTENVEIPFNLEGDFQIFVVTDLANDVYEDTNESNNVSKALPITIFRQTPDLQVTTIGLPVTALSGTPIALSWTVTNLGLGRTNSNYWHDDVYLSLDTTIGSDDIKLGSIFRSQGLDAAESYTVSGNFDLPIDLNGNYYPLVRTDRDNQVFEDVLENNNDKVSSRKIDISLGPVPDLVVQSVDADDQGIAGQPLTVTWTVVNNGTKTEEYFYDAIYLSRDQIFDRANDIYLGYRYHSGGLRANESYSETQSFKVPNGLAGRYYTFVVSDRSNSVYERYNKANNSNFDRLSTEITLPIPADLVVGTITIPTNNIPGQNAVISYTVTNQGTNAAIGTWEDSIYISKDKQWDVNDAFFGRVSQKGVSAGGSYSKTLIEALPGGVSGDYYVIVRSDIRNNLPETNETNNIGASLDAFTLNVEQLNLGVPDTGVLGKGQSVYYRIDVAAGETLQLSLDSQSTLAANELYIRYGDIPSRSQFDFGFTEAFSADQEIVVPTTQAGTYYVLAYGQSVADSQPNFTVKAKLLDFGIRSLSTKNGGNAGKVTIEILGAKFDGETFFALVDEGLGIEIAPSRLDLVDSTKMFATFDLKGRKAGVYDVVVKNGKNQTASLQDGFTVVEGGKANLVTNIIAPSAVRPGTVTPITIQFVNNGDIDLDTSLALVTSEKQAPIALKKEDLFNETYLDLMLQSEHSPFGILAPGAVGSITFYAQAPSELLTRRDSLEFSVSILDDPTAPLNWDSYIKRAESASPESFTDPTLTANFWNSFRSSVGENVGDIQANLLKMQQLSLGFSQREAQVSGVEISEKDYPTVSLSDLYSAALFAASYELDQPVVNSSVTSFDSPSLMANKSLVSLNNEGAATNFNASLSASPILKAATPDNQNMFSLNDPVIGDFRTVLKDKVKKTTVVIPPRLPIIPPLFLIATNTRTVSELVDGTNVYFNVWDGKRIEKGTVNPNNKTYIIIHGFDNTGGNPGNAYTPTAWVEEMANSLKRKEPLSNVIVVDWENGATWFGVNNNPYASAKETTQVLGDAVGQYIIDKKYDPTQITIIGHSLGAQTAGDAGEYYLQKTKQKLGKIIALDAASPLFEGKANDEIVDSTDATNVTGIHTSKGSESRSTVLTGDAFGFIAPFAHQDLYVNPLRTQTTKLVGYNHPNSSFPISVYNHSYAYLILNRLLKGEKITDPNTGKELNLNSLNDIGFYTDKIPSSTGKVWDFRERKVGVNLNPKAINENSKNGTRIGEFSVLDKDFNDFSFGGLTSSALKYTLLDDAGGRFKIDRTNPNRLVVANGSLLDYETKPSYTITVKTEVTYSDNKNPQFPYITTYVYDDSEKFTIQILDVDESKPKDLLPEKPNPDRQIQLFVLVPSDPNDIVGPSGFGDNKWIAPQPIAYTIRFENQATATAPAQTVTISNPLDTDLDFRTFRLGSFGWGGLSFDVPDNTAFYSQRLDLTETRGYFVDVIAGIDIVKGEAFWTVSTIAPETGDIPEDALVGFLPPNNADGIGDGFVNYTIKAKRDVLTGTVIDAKATIIFDTEEPIDTPAIFNTIDADKPTSTVNSVTATVADNEFLVKWTGSDGVNGSALANYTIYVSDNGSKFTPWLDKTTLTETTYIGEAGHRYTFYAIATDNAGNVQSIPSTAQAASGANKAPVLAINQKLTIDERATLVLTNTKLQVTDADNTTEQIVYKLTDLPDNGFLLVNNALFSLGETFTQADIDSNKLAYTHSGNETTSDSFSFTVSDGVGGEISNNIFNIAVNPVNDAPIVSNAIADQTTKQESAFNFQIPSNTFTDIDAGDVLTYSVTLENGNALPNWLTFNPTTRNFSGTPSKDNVGSLNIKAIATDKAGANVSDIFVIAVENLNNAPTLANAIADQTTKKSDSFNFQIPTNTFTDIDAGDVLTYSATLENGNTLPSWLTFNPTTQTFSGIPTNDNVGSLNVKAIATDKAGASVSDIFAIAVENLNNAPTIGNAIGDQTTTENQDFSFTFNVNTFNDIDTGDSLTYAAALKNGNDLPPWLKFNAIDRTFSGKPTKSDLGSLEVVIRATDKSGASVTDTFLLNVLNVEPSIKFAQISDDIFNISNSNGKAKLKVSLNGQGSNLVNELGVFTVDDAQGKINGIAPEAVGYAQAALERSKVIFSAISSLPNGFDSNNLSSILELTSGTNLRFYLVRNGSTDGVKSGAVPLTSLLFSDPSKQKITNLGTDSISLAWKDPNNNSSEFKDLIVTIQSTDEALAIGTNLQGNFQGEVIDLRSATKPVRADFTVNREAAFNNFVGFYQVANENGGIDTNGDGTADILVGQAGYIQAAIRGRVAGIDLSVSNQGTASFTGTFQSGSIFAPFIIVNGTPDALLDSNPNNDPAIYFPYLGANSDQQDHVRLLGSNTFGFEDLAGGGDRDFNDIIIKATLTAVK